MKKIQMNLSQKAKTFSEFFSAFFEFALNFKHFPKKMTLIAYVFPKLLNFEYFQKTMTLIAYVFPKLPTTKNVLR